MPNPSLTVDHLHVILDALSVQAARIQAGATPWADYDGEGLVTSAEGYQESLNTASLVLQDRLSTA